MEVKGQSRSKEEKTIDIRESFDVNFWCEEFNLEARELMDIVKQVGPLVHDVRLHLAKKLLINWPASY